MPHLTTPHLNDRRLAALAEASRDVVYQMSPDWTVMRQLTGAGFLADTVSPDRSWLMAYIPVSDQPRVTQAIDEAVRTASLFSLEHRVIRQNGSIGWTRSRAVPVIGDDGEIEEWFGTAADITDSRRDQEQLQVMVAELQHRTRNLLGIVKSVASRTRRSTENLEQFYSRFSHRLDALARVQGLLSRTDADDGVTFDELVRSEMDAMAADDARVTSDGPVGIRLRSSTVQIVAMALHELMTNALKYGALNQPSGQLRMCWTIGERDVAGRVLAIDWRETGVTLHTPYDPSKMGQGHQLIINALPYQLEADTALTFENDGLHCTIAIPLDH
jgi:two-component system CheB/CheR fusion protein